MKTELKEKFISLWEKYFNNADLPIVFFYTDEAQGETIKPPSSSSHQCLIGILSKVRKGKTVCFGSDSFGCNGGKRYLGYTKELTPNFEYFLSCGIEGKLEWERYKKSPDIVRELVKNSPVLEAPRNYIVFKRWDMLDTKDIPEVVIFFAIPDVLSGLFTLTGFEESERNAVITPFCAGCGAIVLYPYLEKDREHPRGVLGMFDVSARPYVSKDTLSFSLPMNKFSRMVDDMEQSFLITDSWTRINKRVK